MNTMQPIHIDPVPDTDVVADVGATDAAITDAATDAVKNDAPSVHSSRSSSTAQLIHYGSDLFSYDQRTCANQILIGGDSSTSKVEYDEYVVYSKLGDEEHRRSAPARGRRKRRHSETHVTHRFSRDDTSGAAMLDLAFRQDHELDRNGEFRVPNEDEDNSEDMHGRVRRVICFRKPAPFDGAPDLLSISAEDLADLELHPATLQYATRVATESRFWSKDRSVLSIILSFSETPQTPCDFLSMTYDVHSRETTILIRQSWEPRRHRLDDLDEYDHRLESCRDHWAHPLVMPVILLQVDFMRCEEGVAFNTLDVVALEEEVSGTFAFGGTTTNGNGKRSRRHHGVNGKDESEQQHQQWGPMNMTALMQRAHTVLRGTIKLLDTIRWMERAVKLLILSGDELNERLGGLPATLHHQARDLNLGGDRFGDFERQPSPVPHLNIPGTPGSPRPSTMGGGFALSDELEVHWHEIRQYLEGLLRLSMSLETERRMAEARCRAQIDIIYARMAQEDNALNARMAVASTRDSASMKALAVITALFLPGEFIGTLFGMSMFDWLAPNDDDDATQPQPATATATGGGGTGNVIIKDDEPDDVLSKQFWVYWVIAVPLTLFIIFVWRAWWVTQDRYFRRHLSRELSEERYWTSDGKPRELEHGFVHDFFYLSTRRDETAAFFRTETEERPLTSSTMAVHGGGNPDWGYGPGPGFALSRTQTRGSNMRQRQILTARQHSLQTKTIQI